MGKTLRAAQNSEIDAWFGSGVYVFCISGEERPLLYRHKEVANMQRQKAKMKNQETNRTGNDQS
jgi:hypothetical protein